MQLWDIFILDLNTRTLLNYGKSYSATNKENYLGNQFKNKKNFQLEVRKAAGSYVCGEETAMLESLEVERNCSRKTSHSTLMVYLGSNSCKQCTYFYLGSINFS